MKRVPILVAAMLLLATPLAAQDPVKTVPVQFAKGTSSKSIKDNIHGYASVNYTISAHAGQAMMVRLTTSNRSSYFNVTAPKADSAMFNGSIAGDRFSATVPTTGTYTVQVYLMRNAARRDERASYTLNFAVR